MLAGASAAWLAGCTGEDRRTAEDRAKLQAQRETERRLAGRGLLDHAGDPHHVVFVGALHRRDAVEVRRARVDLEQSDDGGVALLLHLEHAAEQHVAGNDGVAGEPAPVAEFSVYLHLLGNPGRDVDGKVVRRVRVGWRSKRCE